MPIPGRAFIVIWHGLQPGVEAEFERWHTEEHLPERLAVPGFLLGTRYINWQQLPHVCFTRYAIEDVDVFHSHAYLARLNAPTAWSRRVQPAMTNFLRGLCETVMSAGHGTGGAIATVRIRMNQPEVEANTSRLLEVAAALLGLPGVTGVQLGRHRAVLSSLVTRETALRPAPLHPLFDHMLMVEAIDRGSLAGPCADVGQALLRAGAAEVDLANYDLQFQLGPLAAAPACPSYLG